MPLNTIYLTGDGSLFYNIDNLISGVQFDLYGVSISNVSLINEDLEFEIEYENGSLFSRVLMYSTAGGTVAAGCGTLMAISYEGVIDNVSNIIFATSFANEISIDYLDCSD